MPRANTGKAILYKQLSAEARADVDGMLVEELSPPLAFDSLQECLLHFYTMGYLQAKIEAHHSLIRSHQQYRKSR